MNFITKAFIYAAEMGMVDEDGVTVVVKHQRQLAELLAKAMVDAVHDKTLQEQASDFLESISKH